MCRGGCLADVEEAFQRIFFGDDKFEDAVFNHAKNGAVSAVIVEQKEFRIHAMRFESLACTMSLQCTRMRVSIFEQCASFIV